MRCAVLTSLLLLLCATTAMATTVTLTMNEVPMQPIHGLTVNKDGVGFTFSEPTLSLLYNSFGPVVPLTFVQDPSIQGFLATFLVSFSEPVTFIQFGLAESVTTPLFGASVVLSNGSVLPFNLTPLSGPFAEAQFTYSGVPVTNFRLIPAPGAAALAFDNLTVSTVPEPGSLSLLVVGMFTATLCAVSRRRFIRSAPRRI